MPDETASRIEPEAYTEEYYRTSVEGHAQFAATGGREVSPRLRRALGLANVRPGQRVLDIACGRGEVVLQSALRGARALGIDYAQAAVDVAREALGHEERVSFARMDATRLALRPGTFDVAFMLDFVEHVYQPELERAFEETARSLKPGGRLIIHTSPNRLFEETVWPRYVRNVHRALLGTSKRAGVRNRFFNQWLLPAGALPPHDEYERRLHVNPQSGGSLRSTLERHGFRVRRVDYWEPPRDLFFPANERALNAGLALLDVVRFLRPLSLLPPLDRLFSNHVWVVAERR